MESMRSLNTSLPRSPRKTRSTQPPEALIQAFKTAALSVTNLYKTAATDQVRGRKTGYQDALDDILGFLDKENLGLDDGEGWRVRRWATERLDGSPTAHTGSESDEDRAETMKGTDSRSEDQVEAAKRARSSSPVAQQAPESSRQISRSTSPGRTTTSPIPSPVALQQPNSIIHCPEIFSFRSAHPYPQDIDMQSSETTGIQSSPTDTHVQAQLSSANPAVRLEMVPRGSRTSLRGGNHPNRHTLRSMSTRTISSATGSKRKTALGDFFDIGNLADGKDGLGGGGKRSRFN